MSYDLRIWDPIRHPPLPATADAALETMERLEGVADVRNPLFERFGAALVHYYEGQRTDVSTPGDLEAYWGCDPRHASAGTSAVYRLNLQTDAALAQTAVVVAAAATLGLVVVDDETGMCFLPNGTVLPEDMQEMWDSTLADLAAGPRDPSVPVPDSRTLLQVLASDLLDALSRGNKRI